MLFSRHRFVPLSFSKAAKSARVNYMKAIPREAFVDGKAEEVEIIGPKKFLRAAGADNNPYGLWWFEFSVLLGLREELERVPLPAHHRREALLGRIRAATAISVDWNTLSEFWLLDVPAAERVCAFVGIAKPQAVFSVAHALHNPGLLLAGGVKQYYIPIKNPLWVSRFGSYFEL